MNTIGISGTVLMWATHENTTLRRLIIRWKSTKLLIALKKMAGRNSKI